MRHFIKALIKTALVAVIGTSATAQSVPALKPLNIVGTILCREYSDLLSVSEGLKISLVEGRARLMAFNKMSDEVGLPLCTAIVQPVTFTPAPHIDFIEGLHSLKGTVDSYVIPVLYRRATDGKMTTGYILLDKPVVEQPTTPTGDDA